MAVGTLNNLMRLTQGRKNRIYKLDQSPFILENCGKIYICAHNWGSTIGKQ